MEYVARNWSHIHPLAPGVMERQTSSLISAFFSLLPSCSSSTAILSLLLFSLSPLLRGRSPWIKLELSVPWEVSCSMDIMKTVQRCLAVIVIPLPALLCLPRSPHAPDSTPNRDWESARGEFPLIPVCEVLASPLRQATPPGAKSVQADGRAELVSGRQLEQPVKGYLRQQEKPDSTALPCFFNRQPRLVISALTELIYCVAPVKL